MALKIREVDGITVIDIEGNIDINSSDIIETVGWLLSTGKLKMILNLENVGMVDYSGLSILAIVYKNVVNHKGKLQLMRIPAQVVELLKIVKLDSVFENYSDEESAVESFYDAGIQELRLRRKFKRLDIHMRVRYSIVSNQAKPKVFDGNVLNVSAAGVYIYTSYTLPMNSLIDLELYIPEGPAPLEASGKVIYIADKEIQPHAYPGMGVAFTHLTPEKERAIIDFIDKNITHRAGPVEEY